MKTSLASIVAVLAVASTGALRVPAAEHEDAHAQAWSSVKQAVAVLHPTGANKCKGKVVFTQEGSKVKIVAHIEGLNPGQKHAFHIHEYGDCSAPDGMSAGGHYNPEKHSHGLPGTAQRHAGDLGNLEADSSGKAHLE